MAKRIGFDGTIYDRFKTCSYRLKSNSLLQRHRTWLGYTFRFTRVPEKVIHSNMDADNRTVKLIDPTPIKEWRYYNDLFFHRGEKNTSCLENDNILQVMNVLILIKFCTSC